MKKLLLASMIAAAAMFTACGGDDDSSPTSGGNGADEKKSSSISDDPSSSTSGGSGKVASCDVTATMNGAQMGHTCMEATSSDAAKKECEAISSEETEKGVTVKIVGKYGSGCASGAKKTCTGKRNGIEVTAYFYDAMSAAQSCEDLMNEF